MKINQIVMPQNFTGKAGVKRVESVDFGALLSNAIDKVNDAEKTSVTYDTMVATGEIDNLHDAMIAAQKAEITLNFALEIRSQVLEAYKELMRLQV